MDPIFSACASTLVGVLCPSDDMIGIKPLKSCTSNLIGSLVIFAVIS